MARASLIPMRILRSVVLPCSFLALAAAAACTQAPQTQGDLVGAPERVAEPGDDTSSKVPASSESKEAPGGTGSSGPVNATCIGQAGFTFDDAGECDVCMSDEDGCCQKLVACFKDDPQCAALQKCVDDCSGTGGGGDGGGGGGPGQAVFVGEVYPSLNPTCGSCHQLGTGGAPIFFGADALATYTQFKARGYHTNGTLQNKGPHAGPPLTAAQVALVQKWRTAEGGGGGGGGGGGDAGGDGGGGALTGKACKDACKTTHAASLEKWNAYQTCITTTCKTQCQ